MLIQGQVGLPPQRVQSGTNPIVPTGPFGEMLETRFLPDYYALAKSGYLFSLGGTAVNPTAFVGGAAGTPLIGIYNPVNSGVDVIIIEAAVGIRTTGSAAAGYDFNHWGVNQGSTPITGTQANPINLYGFNSTGSAVRAMNNVANTAALASSILRPSVSGGLTAATAAPNANLLRDEVKGAIVVAPGGYYAYGQSVALTAASIDYALLWAEIPV